MHLTVLALLLFVSAVSAEISDEEHGGYHRLVGIPLLQKIKAKEESMQLDENSRNADENVMEELEYYSFYGELMIHLLIDEMSFCGSTLLSNKMLVTAAHCWNDGYVKASHVTVVFSSTLLFSGGVRIDTKKVTTHPDFRARTKDNDIAVIHLPYKVDFSSTIFPIALPEGPEITNTFEGYMARTVGFGRNIDESCDYLGLHSIDQEIITEQECKKTFHDFLTPRQMCSKGKDGKCPPHGESGGPLYTYTDRKFLLGIVSQSFTCDIGEPTMFTKVASFLSFIESQGQLPKFTFHFKPDYHILKENITITYTDDETGESKQFSKYAVLQGKFSPPAINYFYSEWTEGVQKDDD